MQVTLTGGAGHVAASLQYNAQDLAFIEAQALASIIDSTYNSALYYNPSNWTQSRDVGKYVIIQKKYADNSIDAKGAAAIVDENNGVTSTIVGGGNLDGQIVLASNGGLTLYAYSGAETVVTGGGDFDLVFSGNTSNVAVYTGPGSGQIYGGAGNTTISTDTGNDYIKGGGGNTTITTHGGNDTIYAGAGNDSITSGVGSSFIFLGRGESTVEIFGTDKVYLSSGSETIDVLGDGSVSIVGASSVSGSGFTLNFQNGDAASTIRGGAGSYHIHGNAGGGVFDGGSAGYNSIVGGSGAVTIVGGGAGDTLQGGSGSASIHAALGNETLRGGSGADIFDLSVHYKVGNQGEGTVDKIFNFGGADLLALGGAVADDYALSTFHVVDGNGVFKLVDGTTVVLEGVTHLTNLDFKN